MTERQSEPSAPYAIEAAHSLLAGLGFSTLSESLRNTPERLVSALMEMLGGYDVDIAELLKTQFTDDVMEKYDQAVCLRDIDFTSVCEHHVLPFEGVAHVAYVPKGSVVGLSKMARLVDAYARRLQVQERLTEQVASALFDATGQHGVAVVIEAQHGCMRCRGVRKHRAVMTTSKMLGCFMDKPEARAEVLSLLLRRS